MLIHGLKQKKIAKKALTNKINKATFDVCVYVCVCVSVPYTAATAYMLAMPWLYLSHSCTFGYARWLTLV